MRFARAPAAAPSRSADQPPAGSAPGQVHAARLIAAASAAIVYLVATGSEILIIRTVRPTEIELTWISDAILATALGIATYFWLNLKWSRQALFRLERERIVLDTQLSIAAEIQRGLLPPPPSAQGVHWAVRLRQAGKIGGDMYDFVQRTPRYCLLLVGDVSGKGIPAALVMASVRSLFRTWTRHTSDPGELAERVSRHLYEDNGGTPYFTCVVARLDLDTWELTYTNAGHPAAVIFADAAPLRGPALLESCGPPVGLFPGQRYETRALALTRGTAAVFVTDGITEAFDELGLSASETIPAIVGALPRPLTADTICDALMERTAAALALDGSGWQDDRTVVAFVLDE